MSTEKSRLLKAATKEEKKNTTINPNRFLLRENWLHRIIRQIVFSKNIQSANSFKKFFESDVHPIAKELRPDFLLTVQETFQQMPPYGRTFLLSLMLQDLAQYYLKNHYDSVFPDNWLTGAYRNSWAIASTIFDGFPNDINFYGLPIATLTLPVIWLCHYICLRPNSGLLTRYSELELKKIFSDIQDDPFPARHFFNHLTQYRRALNTVSFQLKWCKEQQLVETGKLKKLKTNLGEKYDGKPVKDVWQKQKTTVDDKPRLIETPIGNFKWKYEFGLDKDYDSVMKKIKKEKEEIQEKNVLELNANSDDYKNFSAIIYQSSHDDPTVYFDENNDNNLSLEKDILQNIISIAKQNSSIFIREPAIAILADIADQSDQESNIVRLARKALEEIQQEQKKSIDVILSNYYLKTRNLVEPKDFKEKLMFTNFTIQKLIFSHVGWMTWFYAGYRFISTWIEHGKAMRNFFAAQAQCINKSYSLSPISGEYNCTLGGNLDFVPPAVSDSPQEVLDYFLETKPLPQQMEAFFPYLANRKGIDSVGPFGNWPEWDSKTVEKVFGQLPNLSPHLNTINFSTPLQTPLFPSDGRINVIAEMLNRMIVSIVDWSNLNLGTMDFNTLLNTWDPRDFLSEFIADNNALGDDGINALVNWLKNIFLQKISVSGNQMTDNGFARLWSVANNTKAFISDNNNLGCDSLLTVAQKGIPGPMQILSINGNDFTGCDFSGFGQAISQAPNLTGINLAETSCDDVCLADMSQSWSNTTMPLTHFSAANNGITGQGASILVENSQHLPLEVDFSQNGITGQALSDIGNQLRQSQWRAIDLSANPIDSQSVSDFWNDVANSSIRSVRLAQVGLTDVAIEPLIDLLNSGKISLDNLDLSGNYFSAKTAGKLLNAACKSGVSSVILQDLNNVDSDFATALTDVEKYQCEKIDVSKNSNLTSKEIKPITKFLSKIPLKQLIADDTSIDDEAITDVAESLIMPVPNPNDFSLDEARFLENHATKNNQLTFFSARNTKITEKGASKFCQASYYAPDLKYDITQNNIGSWNALSCKNENSASNSLSGLNGFYIGASAVSLLFVLSYLIYALTKYLQSSCHRSYRP